MESDNQLREASIRGDTAAFSELLRQDPYLIDKAYINPGHAMNVFHIAAILGHGEFFRAILQVKSACLNHMCLARDPDGRNPLHLAAMGGQLSILNMVKDYDALIQAALQKADRGGTILHLCVQNNQLEALKLLLQIFPDPDFVGAENEYGMTILHAAIYYNQSQRRRQMIIYLMDTVSYMVNLKDQNGKTALDLLAQQAEEDHQLTSKKFHFSTLFSTKDFLVRLSSVDQEMAHSLLKAEAARGKDVHFTRKKRSWRDWFDHRRDAMMVVSSLIATMAFQSILSPPGGVWQDSLLEGPNAHRVGESVMAKTHPKYYKQLMCASTIAFVSSLSTTVLLIRRWSIHPLVYFGLILSVMCLSVAAIAVSFAISLVTISPKSVRGDLSANGEIAIIVIMVCAIILVAAAREYLHRKRLHA